MELLPAQPDLSLQISPPNTKPTSETFTTSTKTDQDDHHTSSSTTPYNEPSIGLNSSSHITHYINPDLTNLTNQNHHLEFLRSIRSGVHVYNYHNNTNIIIPDNHANYITQSRFLSSAKRNMRSPRMRWTTTLHARFVHAVDLLGGHERATPKSVLELMDVKDITLAHVKSHLQMYRTIKTTDSRATTSDVHESRLSRDICNDILFDIRNSKRMNSSAEYTGSCSRKKQINPKGMKCEEMISPNHFPMNLEFTLGRPQ
ncbi:hypothetical protein QVD17_02084 [Tagetes erecta]|uniref:Myb-like domain-containing protein n=1 Tax=Tagetes erecta TaxID=13708 RepID=A0AAD8P226_TARER|nr:hypothetical protein QVD17_02084 [Tagetes erecta]